MRDLIKEFLQYVGTLMYEAYTAPAQQAAEAIWTLAALIVQLFITFLVVRWMWKKIW